MNAESGKKNSLFKKIERRIKGYIDYKKDYSLYQMKNKNERFRINRQYLYPILTERYADAGEIRSYFWQDLWAAKLIEREKPLIHHDIGSRIDGFVAHLASFRENIVLIDIRPFDMIIPGVDFIQADATSLEGINDESIESLSALCSLEHFGLGRYGDPIDPEGYIKAMKSIVRVIKRGGHAYISVPIGKEHVEFNAHRIFYAQTVIDIFEPMKLVEFSTTFGHDIRYNDDIHRYDNEDDSRGERFGLFHFVKP